MTKSVTPSTRRARKPARRTMSADLAAIQPQDQLRAAALGWAKMWTNNPAEQVAHVASLIAICRPDPGEARL